MNATGRARQKWLTTEVTKITKPKAHLFSSALYARVVGVRMKGTYGKLGRPHSMQGTNSLGRWIAIRSAKKQVVCQAQHVSFDSCNLWTYQWLWHNVTKVQTIMICVYIKCN